MPDLDERGFPTEPGRYLVKGAWGVPTPREIDVYVHPIKQNVQRKSLDLLPYFAFASAAAPAAARIRQQHAHTKRESRGAGEGGARARVCPAA